MARSQAEGVLRYLHHLLGAGSAACDDGRLLQRFVAQRDEDAFAELVARHGPLVFGLCRRVLRDLHDAEDVFQATFLVLARKAAAIRKSESLSCWLHGVAYRLAVKAKTEADKRRQLERRAIPLRETEDADLSWREVGALIDEELQRLPEKQRLPLVLCYLEGLTQDEAARRLSWPRGTLKRRLERGRERLRIRLTRRGVTLGAGLFAAALTESAIKGAIPVALRDATVRAGIRFTTGAIAATRAALLAKGALQAMLTTKLKLGAMVILMLGCAATAAGLATRGEPAAKQPENKADVSTQPRLPENKRVRKDRYGDPLPAGALARLGTVRLRHSNRTDGIVFTPDSKTVIVSDCGGEILFWDVATGREVRRLLHGHESLNALPLAITADGKTLVSGGGGDLIFWNTATGKMLSQTQTNAGIIWQLLCTPDGKTLAFHNENTIFLWDAADNKKLHELKGHKGSVTHLALSPDGKTLASGSWKDGHIRLWDIATGKEKLHWMAHEQDVLYVAFSRDGKTLASAGNHGFRLWDAATGKKLREMPRQPWMFAFFPDGKTMAGLEGDGRVHIYDVVRGKHLRQYDAPSGTLGLSSGEGQMMARVVISPDGKMVATLGYGGHSFDLRDVTRGKLLHPDSGHRHSVTDLAFATDGKTLFSSANSKEPMLAWDAATGELRGRFGKDGEGHSQTLALSPDGKLLAAGYDSLILWDAASRKEVRRCIGPKEIIVSAAWSADGKTLVSSSQDGIIRVWNPASGEQRRAITVKRAKQDWSSKIAVSPDGAIVAASGSYGGAIRLWATASGEELNPLGIGQNYLWMVAVAFSPDGSVLACAGNSGVIRLWEPRTGRLLRRWNPKGDGIIRHLALSRDGWTLVSGHGDSSVRLWEVATGKERASFTGHRGGVGAVAFSCNDRRVASGSEDTTILIWDATCGARPDTALAADRLQALWGDLIETDARRAYRAMWQMALTPKHALSFLAEQLHPAAPLDAQGQKQCERLLADLDSNQFSVREKAESALEKMGPAIEPALRKTLESKPSLEVRRRIDKVLEKVAGWSGERLRTLRALEALEHTNTPETRRLLKSLANGMPRAWLTEEAQAIRRRMDR